MQIIKTNKPRFVQLLPGTYLDVITSSTVNIENVQISSNVFVDIEVFKDGPCLKIHICGTPKVKQIIYE